MIQIGLIGTQSMHAAAFAQACNIPDEQGEFLCQEARVTAVYGVDDTKEHIEETMKKGNIPICVSSMEELYEHCNAFMILQRKGEEHIKYAKEIISKEYPVFIDKPICNTYEDMEILSHLSKTHDTVICGGSGLKYNKQIRELKDQLQSQTLGVIKGATINHSADINSPYGGIFFYLPHAVEMTLELFGYDPVSVNTTVLSHNNFTVCVKYTDYMINLVINGCSPSYVVVNGKNSAVVQVDSADIFEETMKYFVTAIQEKKILKNTEFLTKNIEVIMAIEKSIKDGTEVSLR